MNKLYFAKYLPVGEKVVPGDWMKIHCTGKVVQCTGFDGPKPSYNNDRCVTRPGDHTRVKLFLCSRDIQVGDKVIDSIDGKEYEVKSGFLPPEMVKAIGEISPEAKWVKEGDEFLGPEAGVKCEVFPIHDHDDETEEMIFTDKYGKKVDTPIYLIKGPCGHFH